MANDINDTRLSNCTIM